MTCGDFLVELELNDKRPLSRATDGVTGAMADEYGPTEVHSVPDSGNIAGHCLPRVFWDYSASGGKPG